MKRRTFLKNTSALSLATLVTPIGIFQTKHSSFAESNLEKNFRFPPSSAKPHTWWHWMNGNVTKEGITLDLEAMARVGIGGFQNFDAGTGIPKGPVQYLSPEWLELKKHAIKEAERLGLEFTMHNCPGWSSSGGPWITPDLAMQEVSWSECFVEGGKQTKVQLPQPLKRLDYYQDIVVIAYPSLAGEVPWYKIQKKITTNNASIDFKHVSGENPEGVTIEPVPAGEQKSTAHIQFEFSTPFESQSVTFLTSASPGAGPILLQVSDDGVVFREVISISTGGGFGGGPSGEIFIDQKFTPVKAKYFRLACNTSRHFSQIRFSMVPRAEDWQKRANYAFNRNGVKDISETDSIAQNTILDITPHVNHDGLLTWDAPTGNWTILRLGYTPMGTMNRSAPDTGVGLECDKYSSTAFEFHFNKMMENLLPALKSISSTGKVGLLIDSYEVGMQNWTEGFEVEFKKRNGYDILTLLPAFTGRIVENADTTNRFLWDVRRTQGDLMADNYYGKFTALCHQHNMISYIQPYDRGPMEEMQIGSRIDINVGEFWNSLSSVFQNNWTMRRTVKLSAAIAHTNNQKVVAAESYTGEPESAKWQEYPFGMKALGDKMFTQGLNRIVFHRFAHQPHPTARPGMTMGPWGIHFDRTNTWWEPGKAWLEYLARCQYLLQEGNFVADLVYFTGEDAGVYTKVTPDELNPTPPEGYDYDLINAEVLLKKATVVDRKLVLPHGMRYSILVLQQQKSMTLELLRRLRAFVRDGLIVVGSKPERTPGLRDWSEGDSEFQRITAELWGSINGSTILENSVGNGRVVWGKSLERVLNDQHIKPDFEVTSQSGDAPVTFIHRKFVDTEIYFLANQRRTREELVCTFRVESKQPEIWDPVTGTLKLSTIYKQEEGRISLPVQLAPYGSVFVMFRAAPASKAIVAVSKENSSVFSVKPFSPVDRTLFADVTQNFSIALWVKPESHVMLSTRNFMDGQDPWTDYYTIYPPPGKKMYGAEHATCGLAVGRNGVAVWEHAENKPVFALAAPTSISGWSHIVLVYVDGVPSVYVNGVFIQKGEKSKYIVHPGLGKSYLKEGASYYNGDMTQPVLFKEVLAEGRIKELVASQTKLSYPAPGIELIGAEKNQLLFFENGNFELTGTDGKKSPVSIKGTESLPLDTAWTVSFPPDSGAPSNIELPALTSLHKHSDAGVKYFSGTCTHTRTFTAPKNTKDSTKRIYLDLGQVEILAEVILNDNNLGVLWTRPYRMDVTGAIQAGENKLEIRVTNGWPNRLIGDEQVTEPYKYAAGAGGSGFASLGGGAIQELPEWYQKGLPKPDDGKVTFTTWKHYRKDSPLLESGLIGPVFLYVGIVKDIKL